MCVDRSLDSDAAPRIGRDPNWTDSKRVHWANLARYVACCVMLCQVSEAAMPGDYPATGSEP